MIFPFKSSISLLALIFHSHNNLVRPTLLHPTTSILHLSCLAWFLLRFSNSVCLYSSSCFTPFTSTSPHSFPFSLSPPNARLLPHLCLSLYLLYFSNSECLRSPICFTPSISTSPHFILSFLSTLNPRLPYHSPLQAIDREGHTVSRQNVPLASRLEVEYRSNASLCFL